jgi:uncharacterized protein YcbK (DUF882 family)
VATVAAPTRHRLSAHFVIEEFDCKDSARTRVPAAAIPALEELCKHMLEPLREKYGRCTVHSGYRTVAHNAAVHGEANSQHIYQHGPASVAADVEFATGTVAEWAASARWRFSNKSQWTAGARGGCGDYPKQTFIHVDSGSRRDWHEA